MGNKKGIGIVVTSEQAFDCLNIKIGSKVHSISVLTPSIKSGVDLELVRIRDILEDAAANAKLFLSDNLDNIHHNILAFDQKTQEWTYLECDAEKVDQLKQMHTGKNTPH